MTNSRTPRHYEFGAMVRNDFSSIVPLSVAETAAATCRIEVQGQHSIGNEWGMGLSMKLQTFGHVPLGIGGDDCSFNRSGSWLRTHSRQAVEVVLNAIGYTVDDLLVMFGMPMIGSKYSIDLVDVVVGQLEEAA